MEKKHPRAFLWLFLSLSCSILLVGCGKKGPPEPIDGSTYSFPGKYPPEE